MMTHLLLLNLLEKRLLFVNISKKFIALLISSTIGNLEILIVLKMALVNGLLQLTLPNLDLLSNKILLLKVPIMIMVLFFTIKTSIVMMVFIKPMFISILLVWLLSWLDIMMKTISMPLN
jgi:hypothetical protein